MNNYLIGIGKHIKEIRKEQQLTISSVAEKADVSKGLISRIENGRTIPSLPVLLNIIDALGIAVKDFFNSLPLEQHELVIVTKAEENYPIEKEDEAEGFAYNYIFGKQMASIGFEAVLLKVEPHAKRKKVITDAYEFKYILSGSCSYEIADKTYTLGTGDTIFFDGRIPHVPKNTSDSACDMLVFYFFI